MGERIAFYVLSIFLVIGALGVVISKSLFRSALFLALALSRLVFICFSTLKCSLRFRSSFTRVVSLPFSFLL